MKTIGLIGGMSWESTATYYKVINETVKAQLGGLHSAKCVLYSVDFDEIERCQASGNWIKSAELLCIAARSLERAGADFIIICTNTMHKVFTQIQSAVDIPFLHIAELTANVLTGRGITKVALFGTKYTMEQDFYKSKLIERSIEVLVPEEGDRELINDVIYKELCLGVISEPSRQSFYKIAHKMSAAGIGGIILGCTEIGLLMSPEDIDIPLFDTAVIHAQGAALHAIG